MREIEKEAKSESNIIFDTETVKRYEELKITMFSDNESEPENYMYEYHNGSAVQKIVGTKWMKNASFQMPSKAQFSLEALLTQKKE